MDPNVNSQLDEYFEIIIIILYTIYELAAFFLLFRLQGIYAKKWLYPFIMAYMILLTLNYLFEITIAAFEISNLENSVIYPRITTVLFLHSAFIVIMYTTAFSTKYILILEQKLWIYNLLLMGIGIGIIVMLFYVGIRIFFAYNDFPENTEYYWEGSLASFLYFLYAVITWSNILIKKNFEYPKYAKRKFYYWSIVTYFLICSAVAGFDMLIFYINPDTQFVYDSCANALIDALPIYSAIYFMGSAREKSRKNSPRGKMKNSHEKPLLSFFDK